jgi:hypothetical protein
MMKTKGFATAFSREVFCLHAGQSNNWGYRPEEVHDDPRKSGYGKPYTYDYDAETYEPIDPALRM